MRVPFAVGVQTDEVVASHVSGGTCARTPGRSTAPTRHPAQSLWRRRPRHGVLPVTSSRSEVMEDVEPPRRKGHDIELAVRPNSSTTDVIGARFAHDHLQSLLDELFTLPGDHQQLLSVTKLGCLSEILWGESATMSSR